MGKIAERRLRRALTGVRTLALDTPVLIYHLEDVQPYAELTTSVFSIVEARAIQIVLSVITLAEVLVGAWKGNDGTRAVQLEAALKGIPGVVMAGVDADSAAKAAEIRSRTNLPLPDALIIASTAAHEAKVIVTNDGGWRRKPLPCRVLILDDLL